MCALINAAGAEYLEHEAGLRANGSLVAVLPRYDDRFPVASLNTMQQCFWRGL